MMKEDIARGIQYMSEDPNSVSLEFDYIERRYRVVYHYGSGVIEMFEYKCKRRFLLPNKWYWDRIFMGHTTPIKKMIHFADEQRKLEKSWNTEDEK